MVYADYAYYINHFSPYVSESDFPKLAERASSYLDYYTRGKAAGYTADDAVKLACCALAEQYQLIDSARSAAKKALETAASAGGELQSQSVGSWSRTYRSGGDSAKQATEAAQAAQAALAAVARQYLAHTGLLYRGRGCACGSVSPCGDAL